MGDRAEKDGDERIPHVSTVRFVGPTAAGEIVPLCGVVGLEVVKLALGPLDVGVDRLRVFGRRCEPRCAVGVKCTAVGVEREEPVETKTRPSQTNPTPSLQTPRKYP